MTPTVVVELRYFSLAINNYERFRVVLTRVPVRGENVYHDGLMYGVIAITHVSQSSRGGKVNAYCAVEKFGEMTADGS